MKKCPYCGEEIQDSAKKCRYCGEWLKDETEEGKTIERQNASRVEDSPSSSDIEEINNGQTKIKNKSKIKVPVFWPGISQTMCLTIFFLIEGLLVLFDLLPDYDFPFSALSGIISVIIYGIAYIQFKKHKSATSLCKVSLVLMVVSCLMISIIELSNGFTVDQLAEEEPMFNLLYIPGLIGAILLFISWLREYTGRVYTAAWILLIGSVVIGLISVLFPEMEKKMDAVSSVLELYALFGIFFGEKMGGIMKEIND